MSRTGEGAGFIPKKFALQQVRWDRSAVHLEESAMCPWRKLMNQAPKNFFAGAAFSQQQDWNVDVRDQGGLRTDLPHGGTGSDEEHIVAEFLDFSRISLLILAETLIDDRIELGFLKGLGKVILRAETHGLDDFASVAYAGEHDDFHARTHLAELLEGLQAIDSGHQDVKQNHIGFEAFFDALQGFFTRGGGLDLVIVDFEQGPDVPEHSRFIIDQQDVGRFTHFVFPLVVLLREGFSGTRNENLLPAPGSLSTQSLPPIAFTSRRAMARPRPMPSDCVSLLGSRKKSSNTST